ncbi:MAG TPA: AI-2E family transporter [Candidatus Paceibacterota bacterium]|jgi:predicted PurR-regulated permease PerM|nr:AI-2E family transporter [Candidatus Paceibacterota bacterium]
MDAPFIQKYFFSALLIVAIAGGIVLFWPFLKLIILAVIFSVLFHPLYRWFHKVVHSSRVAALLTILSFVIILCVPIYFIGTIVLKQTHSMYAWLIAHGSIGHLTDNLSLHLHHLFPSLSFNIQASINDTISNLSTKLGSIFTTTAATVVYFILMLLTMFYFLKDGKAWKEALIELSPLSFESNTTVISILKNAVTGIFKGYFIIGLAQGTVTGIGFYLFHIPHPALFGLLAAFCSLIPAVGSSLIAIPTVIFLLATSRTGAGIGYAIWAVCFSISIDNILNPYIVGKQIAIHPLLVLFSILGGLALMGPIGFIIGPLLTSFIYALISVYKLEMAPEVVAE